MTYGRDFRSVVDEIHSGVGVVAEGNLLLHEDFVGEGVQDFGLLVLRRVGLGGVCGAAERVVFLGALMARLEGSAEGGDGKGEDGEESCEMHFGRFGGGGGDGDRRWEKGFAE